MTRGSSLVLCRSICRVRIGEKWCWHKAQCVAPLQSTCPFIDDQVLLSPLKRWRRWNAATKGQLVKICEFMQSFCLKHRRFNYSPWLMQTLKNLLQCSAHLIGRRTTLRDLETILNVEIVTQKDLSSILRCEKSIWIFLLHNNANSRFVNHKEVVSSLADNWAPINRCWRHERTRSVNVNEWMGNWRGPSSLVFSFWQTERRRRRRYFLKRV